MSLYELQKIYPNLDKEQLKNCIDKLYNKGISNEIILSLLQEIVSESFSNIPKDVIEQEIFKFLDQSELQTMKLVSKNFKSMTEKEFEKRYQQIKNNYNYEHIQFTEKATQSPEERLNILKVFDLEPKMLSVRSIEINGTIIDFLIELKNTVGLRGYLTSGYELLSFIGHFEENKLVIEKNNILSIIFKYLPIDIIKIRCGTSKMGSMVINSFFKILLKSTLSKLHTLDIYYVKLKTLNIDPDKMPMLTELSVNNCDLLLFPDKINKFKHLTKLSLKNNKITSIPPLNPLQVLNLQRNPLNISQKTYDKLKNNISCLRITKSTLKKLGIKI